MSFYPVFPRAGGL